MQFFSFLAGVVVAVKETAVTLFMPENINSIQGLEAKRTFHILSHSFNCDRFKNGSGLGQYWK